MPVIDQHQKMEEMFLRLGFSQTVAMKIVDDQGKDSPWTLTILSDEDIVAICDMIRRPGDIVSGKTPDRRNQISVLAAEEPQACSAHVQDSTSVLQYQHQWELEQKKADDDDAPKVDKNNWAKTMENILLYLKLVRGMRGTPLAYVVQCNIKVAYISPGYDAYLRLDEEMITRSPIADSRMNLKLNQEALERVYLDYWCDTFKIDNALVYQILLKMFMDMDAYVYVKQRKEMQDSQAVFFDIHKLFLDPNHVARQATKAER